MTIGRSAQSATIRQIGAAGRVIGESHHMATLTDHEVDLVHALREAGLTMAAIASKMEVTRGCVWKILHGYRRSQWPERVIRITTDRTRK